MKTKYNILKEISSVEMQLYKLEEVVALNTYAEQ